MSPAGKGSEAVETLDRICGLLDVFQARAGYRFGMEALFLCGFVRAHAKRMVDLGTGCGVIPLVLVRVGRVESAIGVEIQESLWDRARRSVLKNDLSSRIEVLHADLKALDRVLPGGRFDLVTSNPPFGRGGSGVVCSNRERAIGRHEILCTLNDVVGAAARLLRPLGRFDAVLLPGRLPEMLKVCEEHGLKPSRLRMVHGKIGLAPKNCLFEAVRGGRGNLRVEPPLLVYDANGEYTPEVRGMLYPEGDADGKVT